jgi:KamA family protein
MTAPAATERYRPVDLRTVADMPQWALLDEDLRSAIEVVGEVLPFRTNRYVMDNLIDWSNVPYDPIFQLVFPQREMLTEEDYADVEQALRAGDRERLAAAVSRIRMSLNPHPAGQLTHNVPELEGRKLAGVQHKYRETLLFFPAPGQTCHAYCTYCFRWAQFVGLQDIKFQTSETDDLLDYLREHRDITDVLFTGGDPMIMRTKMLRRYIEPLLSPEFDHVQNIRIGTKAVAYWPQRFVSDADADDCLRLFDEMTAAGRHVAIMGHYSHPVELEPDVSREAVRRIRQTGAQIRMQAPLIKHVNDNPAAWAELWRTGVRLGLVPYYMFVERDTGPRHYFEVPLERCWEVYRGALEQVSGLARTVRGPSMSATPGKVEVLGVQEVAGEKVFILRFLQGRDPDWVARPFFARFDPQATWLDQLEPAFGEDSFFFEEGLRALTS